ncbi:hypothetical protein GGR56DRAFT_671839 [Xylariaceae sp. FL0804]|nr:hypothetical protein GGR56DRAFT_671839 [Xylariaceae sp. FL0804]
MSSSSLSSTQLQALLDILVHHETYAEVQSFREPEAIDGYGYPFATGAGAGKSEKSSSPLLQLLLTRMVLPIPGIRDVSPDFWHTKFRGIMSRFGEVELSESYDKGTLGSRKRLATAASVVHETVTRALLSGVGRGDELPDLRRPYDLKAAEGLNAAWHDSIRQLIYGNLADELFNEFTKSGKVEAHSPGVKAAVEYAILYLATFLHNVFVLSAEGPYLLKLIDSVHKLVPYSVIGQTLRVGNAGTMINAMVRLFLAKMSIGSISNWIGLTSNAADGMNLLQRIISMVLDWDAGEFRKAVDQIKRSKERPSDAHLAAIDRYLGAGREVHAEVRQRSVQQQQSIIIAILDTNNPQLAKQLTESQHTQCLEYYSAQLAIRDREKIVEVLCRSNPDLTTSIIRDGVSVFEPMIRAIHKNVDLRKHFGAFESFVTDFIKTAKPKRREEGHGQAHVSPPSVEDFVALLQRNRFLLYDYLHDFATGCPELRDTWKAWAIDAVKAFRRERSGTQDAPLDAGSQAPALKRMFEQLPEAEQAAVREAIDAHTQYLSGLQQVSTQRTQRIIDSMENHKGSGSDVLGPGVYASRWQALLDETLITPGRPYGPPRRGRDVKGLKALGKTEAVASADSWDLSAAMEEDEKARPTPPAVRVVIDALGTQFKELVADVSSRKLPR